jgi:hypothetical protein
MRAAVSNTRLLGYVQLRIGEKVYALPVQAATFDRDSGVAPGGFFDEQGELGILVDERGSTDDMEAQIAKGSAEAVRYFSKKVLN